MTAEVYVGDMYMLPFWPCNWSPQPAAHSETN